jgi:hypothetical protein
LCNVIRQGGWVAVFLVLRATFVAAAIVAAAIVMAAIVMAAIGSAGLLHSQIQRPVAATPNVQMEAGR